MGTGIPAVAKDDERLDKRGSSGQSRRESRSTEAASPVDPKSSTLFEEPPAVPRSWQIFRAQEAPSPRLLFAVPMRCSGRHRLISARNLRSSVWSALPSSGSSRTRRICPTSRRRGSVAGDRLYIQNTGQENQRPGCFVTDILSVTCAPTFPLVLVG
jgi:hypothetical protein